MHSTHIHINQQWRNEIHPRGNTDSYSHTDTCSSWLEEKVKQDIDRDIALGIIEQVLVGTHTILSVFKVNLQKLNDATMRQTHHISSLFNQVSIISAHTRKGVLGTRKWYHRWPLFLVTYNSTTFITKWGCYRYCRVSQIFHGSGDGYTRQFDDIIMDMTC